MCIGTFQGEDFLCIFLSLSDIDREISAFRQKDLARFVRTGFEVSPQTYWGENNFKEKLFF